MPLRFIGKALGGIVHYDKGNLTITLDNQVKEWTLETITSKAKAEINNKGYSFSEVCKIAEEKMGLLGQKL